jgi:hypothetical protein
MSPVAIGSAAGAAALTVGRGALGAFGNGLSFAAELVRASTGEAIGRPQDSTSPAKAVRQDLQRRMDELRARIHQTLAAAGIGIDPPATLISDGQGGIAVAEPHPHRDAIQRVMGNDFLMERDFNALAGDYQDFLDSGQGTDLPASFALTVG